MGTKYTKGQAAATEKYMSDKHTIRVVVQKEKADEYKTLAAASGKSLNKYIIDCVENKIGGQAAYSHELAELMGEVYSGILKIIDKNSRDPFGNVSVLFPMRCLMLLLPLAITLRVSEELNAKMALLVKQLKLEDMDRMLNTPMPAEYAGDFQKGMLKVL